MVNKKQLTRIILIVLVLGYYVWTEYQPGSVNGSVGEQNNNALLQAIANQHSDVQVTGAGEVIKLLTDDNDGSRHQRFLVKIPSGDVILIAHNIDLAPRVDALRRGDQIRFNGEYEWNNKGGVVHWTHKDPRSKHLHGWLEHQGEKYW